MMANIDLLNYLLTFPFQQKKNGNETVITISYKLKFIDSATFIASSSSKFVDNLTEVVHKTKCKDCGCFLEYESVTEKLIKYKCLSCNKGQSNKTDEELKNKKLEEYHDLYLKSDTLHQADVFENFRKMH